MSTVFLTFVPGFTSQSQVVALDGIRYYIETRWFDRLGHWYVDIYTEDFTPIALGQRLAPGGELAIAAISGTLFPYGFDGAGLSELGDNIGLAFNDGT